MINIEEIRKQHTELFKVICALSLILGFVWALMGCGAESSENGGRGSYAHASRISDWRFREIRCLGEEPVENNATIDYGVVFAASMSTYVVYIEEEEDYWETSCEVLEAPFVDCDGAAILLYRNLREYDLDDQEIWLVIYKYHTPEGQEKAHMANLVYYGPGEYDFWIVEPGGAVRDFAYFKDVELVVRFNLFYTLWY